MIVATSIKKPDHKREDKVSVGQGGLTWPISLYNLDIIDTNVS